MKHATTMTTAPQDLEARVRTMESRQRRSAEDMTAHTDTLLEIREDVQLLRRDIGLLRLDQRRHTRKIRTVQNDVDWMKRGMRLLLANQGLTVEREDGEVGD